MPGFYDPQVDPSLLSLHVYLENLFSPIKPELHYRHPHVKHFRIGLILSYPRARAQAKMHYDYSPDLRRQEPELRDVSCLMVIDGFGFTYLGDNDVWQRLWVPENCWIAFIDGCLHFGSANPLKRPALRAFYYVVANEMDFPPNTVFAPDTGYPNPLSQTVGCEQDQDPGFTRPPSSRIHIPTRDRKYICYVNDYDLSNFYKKLL